MGAIAKVKAAASKVVAKGKATYGHIRSVQEQEKQQRGR